MLRLPWWLLAVKRRLRGHFTRSERIPLWGGSRCGETSDCGLLDALRCCTVSGPLGGCGGQAQCRGEAGDVGGELAGRRWRDASGCGLGCLVHCGRCWGVKWGEGVDAVQETRCGLLGSLPCGVGAGWPAEAPAWLPGGLLGVLWVPLAGAVGPRPLSGASWSWTEAGMPLRGWVSLWFRCPGRSPGGNK